MFPLYAFFLNAFCSEARYGKQHQREPFGVIGIIEHTAIVVQIIQNLVCGYVKPVAVHYFKSRVPQ